MEKKSFASLLSDYRGALQRKDFCAAYSALGVILSELTILEDHALVQRVKDLLYRLQTDSMSDAQILEFSNPVTLLPPAAEASSELTTNSEATVRISFQDLLTASSTKVFLLTTPIFAASVVLLGGKFAFLDTADGGNSRYLISVVVEENGARKLRTLKKFSPAVVDTLLCALRQEVGEFYIKG